MVWFAWRLSSEKVFEKLVTIEIVSTDPTETATSNPKASASNQRNEIRRLWLGVVASGSTAWISGICAIPSVAANLIQARACCT